MKGQENNGSRKAAVSGRELLWQARDVVSQSIRKDPLVRRIVGNAEKAGVNGDSRFVVLAGTLLIERSRMLKENEALTQQVLALTKPQPEPITFTQRLKAAWRKLTHADN